MLWIREDRDWFDSKYKSQIQPQIQIQIQIEKTHSNPISTPHHNPTPNPNPNPFDDGFDGGGSDTTSSIGGGDLGPEVDPWRARRDGINMRAASASDNNTWGGGDPSRNNDGVFVDRHTHELMIEQKLKPVTEETIMESIIEERSIEIEKINKGIIQVNEMFLDLSSIVKQQQNEIETIFTNAEESAAKTKEAFEQVVRANELQRDGNCIIS